MSELYGRRYEIYIGDTERPFIEQTGGRQFQMQAEITVDFGSYNSYADISIYNLSRDTENRISKRGERVIVSAGYHDSIGTLFTGDIVNIFREKSGTSKITRLICRGGGSDLESKTVTTTLGAGTSVVTALQEIASALGMPLVVNAEDFAGGTPYARGVALDGDPAGLLKTLSESHDFRWVIDNGRLVVVRNGSARAGTTKLITQFTGMENAPDVTDVGCDVTTRLDHTIKIGGKFRVESSFKNYNFSGMYFRNIPESAGSGEYRIFKLVHSLDSHGDSWSTRITGIR